MKIDPNNSEAKNYISYIINKQKDSGINLDRTSSGEGFKMNKSQSLTFNFNSSLDVSNFNNNNNKEKLLNRKRNYK